MGEWYKFSFYDNLDNDLRAGRAMTYGPIGGKPISVAEAHRIVARTTRAEGSLPPLCSALLLISNRWRHIPPATTSIGRQPLPNPKQRFH